MYNIFKKISFDSLLITILVSVLFIYMILTLDEDTKEGYIDVDTTVDPAVETPPVDETELNKTLLENAINDYNDKTSEVAVYEEDILSLENRISDLEPIKDNEEITELDTELKTLKFDKENSVRAQEQTDARLKELKSKFPEIYINNYGTDEEKKNYENSKIPNVKNIDNSSGGGDAGSKIDAVKKSSSQDIVQTTDKKTTVVHNHYYGGNKELGKFMDKLLKEQQNNLNKNQSALVDQGSCKALNDKLKTSTYAEIQNNRFLADMKNKCEQHEYSQASCKVEPTQDQSSLIGTLLEESNNTKYGSLVAK
jgi:hypothetical protein